ncbi:hypothetical protein P280DRAFT_545364 [Massarina eburnea CBS 473.64]|uniref:Uncharacterized protein n=1 Tax=Massarina eburnea CBS 473.64 TaxID=1395130 RepID=A0A6A6SBZ7_9PLEO|nr:hypothetical protein P280DRAFT_545364 [Massarina eburnea CBS 473.64]
MAHEADFCGDRLRLSAFLRVVGKTSAPRPTRLQRRLNGQGQRRVIATEPLLRENDLQSAETLKSLPVQTALETETVINTKKTRKAAPSTSRRSLRTRETHPLPVNGLALVRTTSEIGLPSPGHLETSFSIPITDADPIEDTQSHRIIQKPHCPQRQHASPREKTSANLIHRRAWPRPVIIKQREQLHVLAKSSPIRKSAGRSIRQNIVAISDGFVGPEVTIPTATVRKRARKPNRTPKEKKDIIPTNSGLVLAEGPLPNPSVPMDASTDAEPMIPSMDLPFTDSQREMNPSEQQSRRDEPAIADLLSRVSAPARVDSDSESSENEEEQDEDADDVENVENGSQNTRGSTHSGESDSPMYTRYMAEEVNYFADAMFGLQQRQDGGDFFWSQYGMEG